MENTKWTYLKEQNFARIFYKKVYFSKRTFCKDFDVPTTQMLFFVSAAVFLLQGVFFLVNILVCIS